MCSFKKISTKYSIIFLEILILNCFKRGMRVYCKSCICGNLTSATARFEVKKRINVNSTSCGESKYFFGGVQMYAIIKTGGKQYKVAEGDSVFVEKLDAEEGSEVTFDEVILVANGDDVKVGTPLVDGAKVTAKVEKQGKEKKVVTFKYKPKKHSHSKYGHRQPYTKVTVEKIEA